MEEEHSASGVDHLQRAAHELIAAAREFLDAAEGLVEDRDVVRDVADLFGGVVREFGSLGARARRAGGRPFESDLDDRDRDRHRDGADDNSADGGGVRGAVEDRVSGGEAPSDTVASEETQPIGWSHERGGGRAPGSATRRGEPRPSAPRVRRIDVE